MRVQQSAGRTLAAVVAHPDDDAYGVAGIVALHAADPRFRFVLVHATDGDAGSIAPGTGATRATLGAVRRDEDRRAWEVLGRTHPDHIAVGRATDSAFVRLVGDGRPGLRRLVHGAIKQSVIDRWNAGRVAAGLSPWDPSAVYHLRGVPDAEIGVEIDTTSVAHRIRAAMREHRTQRADMDSPDVPEDQKLRSVSRETEVLVWPPGAPGQVLADVFQGLP